MRVDLYSGLREARALACAFGSMAFRIGDPSPHIKGIATDSREVLAGDLFVALRGAFTDGAMYLGEALERGASALLMPFDVAPPMGSYWLMQVNDPQSALMNAVRLRRRLCGGRVIAISGSTGKTTVKEAVAALLSEHGHVEKSEGNFNSGIGMPLSFLSMEEANFYVLELGISHPHEMEEMAHALLPHIAVLTNVGSAHIGNFESYAALVHEKLGIAAAQTGEDILLIPEELDTPLLKSISSVIYRVGRGERADFCAEKVVFNAEGTRASLRFGEREIRELFWGVPGRAGLSSLMLAASVGVLCGLDDRRIREGLSRASSSTPRMKKLTHGKRLLLEDCYNASPESVATSLESTVLLAGSRPTVAVLGDMAELGDRSEALHRAVGECAARDGIGMLITYGKLANGIKKGAVLAGMSEERIHSFEKGEEGALIDTILRRTPENAVVLFKGARKMALEKIMLELRRT